MINFKQLKVLDQIPLQSASNGRWWPACLCADDAARYFGWPPYFMHLLVRAGHIKPLGRPAKNSRKWYARVELDRLGGDAVWLDKAIQIVDKHVRASNAKSLIK